MAAAINHMYLYGTPTFPTPYLYTTSRGTRDLSALALCWPAPCSSSRILAHSTCIRAFEFLSFWQQQLLLSTPREITPHEDPVQRQFTRRDGGCITSPLLLAPCFGVKGNYSMVRRAFLFTNVSRTNGQAGKHGMMRHTCVMKRRNPRH